MTIPIANSLHEPKEPPSPAVVMIPDDLITEILSLLSVKALMRLRCVSKVWNTLIISDPIFVKMHLNRSVPNPHLTLFTSENNNPRDIVFNPFPKPHYASFHFNCHEVVGSCNGLICFLDYSYPNFWFCFWNPATRTLSEKLGFFPNFVKDRFKYKADRRFMFGYDKSNDTYKVLAVDSKVTTVTVFSFGDNIWKDIQSFPAFPLQFQRIKSGVNHGVYLRSSFNWLAIRNVRWPFLYDPNIVTIEQFVIISLDLGTEKYRQLMIPKGVTEMPNVEPTVCVLMDCLCFSHLFKWKSFVIWKMTKFGVEESWTQFLQISLSFQLYYRCPLLPLGLSQKDDTLILGGEKFGRVILFEWRDNEVRQIGITETKWCLIAKDYVQSLVSIC